MQDKLNQLLTDMRCEVVYSHVATMPIPLYERVKEVIKSMAENECKMGVNSAACRCEVCNRLY